jgi:hypothetical protein
MPYNLTTWDHPALLPIREEGVLRIFIALKIHRLGWVLNPQPLGPVASTLTTTQARRLRMDKPRFKLAESQLR